MCLLLESGSTKYLGCGHVQDYHEHYTLCGNAACITSPQHPTPCASGSHHVVGCMTCTSTRACGRHHTCQIFLVRKKQYGAVLSGNCNTCSSKWLNHARGQSFEPVIYAKVLSCVFHFLYYSSSSPLYRNFDSYSIIRIFSFSTYTL
jgi:hypothetical protein